MQTCRKLDVFTAPGVLVGFDAFCAVAGPQFVWMRSLGILAASSRALSVKHKRRWLENLLTAARLQREAASSAAR